MRSRNWGGTKIDLRNADDRSGRKWADHHATQNALSTKIAVKQHALSEAAECILMASGDYDCVDSNAELARRRAVTRDGTISFGGWACAQG